MQLGISQELTEGSMRLFHLRAKEIFTPEFSRRANLRSNTLEVREKAVQTGLIHGSWERFHWTAKRTALLGTMPDFELARRLGCGRVTVGRKRLELNIPEIVPLRTRLRKSSTIAVSIERLRLRRLELGLRYADVASRAGITSDSYRQLEHGVRSTVRPRTLQAIARALGCAESSLMA